MREAGGILLAIVLWVSVIAVSSGVAVLVYQWIEPDGFFSWVASFFVWSIATRIAHGILTVVIVSIAEFFVNE